MHNKCAPWEFQSICKKIQTELKKIFPDYIKLVDDYDYDFPVNYHNRFLSFKSFKRNNQVLDDENKFQRNLSYDEP